MDATLSGLALRRMGGLAGTRVFARETRANPSLNSATSLRLNEPRKFRADVANAEIYLPPRLLQLPTRLGLWLKP